MKKILGILIAVILVFSLTATFLGAAQEISVKLNGVKIDFADVEPQIINSRTMVPLRAIFEALGASVDWDDATKTVKSTKGDISIELAIGKNELKKNGTSVALDVPGQIVNSRTLVPVRAISEAYECDVQWDDATKTVLITSSDVAKASDMMPQAQSYFMVNSLAMSSASTRFVLPSGWVVDNKNVQNLTDGKIVATIADFYEDDHIRIYRDFDEISDGRIIFTARCQIASEDDGVYIALGDRNEKMPLKLTTDNGHFTLCGTDKIKTASEVLPENPKEYVITFHVNLDNDTAYAYINGEKTGTVALLKDTALSRITLGSTDKGTGQLVPTTVTMYHNYAVADTFISSADMMGKAPYSYDVTGDMKVVEYYVTNKDDNASVKINALSGSENVASKTFPAIAGKGIFEAYVLLPKAVDGAFFTLTSDGDEAVSIESKGGAWYAGDVKLRDFTENVWQILRIETDTVNNKAIVKVCGKTLGTVPFTADYIDGLKIGITSSENAVMWFDDVTAKTYVEHDDYPAEPVVNNDDGYNVGIHVCNLWHDALVSEGWQAVTPFPELEPWLGYYDEGSPELADWELKIMAEHGIDFQHACWYPPQHLVTTPIKMPNTSAPAIHDGYFNAKYSDKVKLAIMWENANMTYESSLSDFKNYIWNYWKEYYFSDPRYMTIENKPILSIWVFDNFVKFFGGMDGAKEAVEFMREDIKTLGYDDILLIVPRRDSAKVEELGLDAMFYYHYYKQGSDADHQINTLNADKSDSTHIIPTLAIGHNGIGRYDERSGIISVDEHKRVAEYIRDDYLKSVDSGDWRDNTLFVSNWNEYSEGHYISPSGEFGYGFLENIKDVYTNDKTNHKDLDVVPTDAQKDRITKMHPATSQEIRNFRTIDPSMSLKLKPAISWDFSKEETFNELTLNSIEIDEKTSTGIKAHAINKDPAITSKHLNVDLTLKPVIHFRMKVEKMSGIQIFFTTSNSAVYESNVKYKSLSTENVGQMHDYYISMTDMPDWTGVLTGLRIDPLTSPDSFEIELIELLVPDEEVAKVEANGMEMEFDFFPVVRSGDVEVTASSRRGFFTMLNLFHTWNRFENKLYVESKHHNLVMTVGSDKALLDGKEINLGYTLTLKDGLPVIRLKSFCDMLGHKTEFKDGKLVIKSTDRVTATPYHDGYIGWDFDQIGNVEGFYSGNTTLTANNGMLNVLSPRTRDINIFPSVININANKYTKLAVRLKANPDEIEGTFFQMFFAVRGVALNEQNSVKHTYDMSKFDKDGMYEFVIDLAANKAWTGIISDFRFDPFNAQAEAKVDYIRFVANDNEEYKEPIKEIKRIDFDSKDDLNICAPSNDSLSVSDGFLNLTEVTNRDPGVIFKMGGSITAEECNVIKVGIKVDKTYQNGNYAQLFFTTDTSTDLDAQKSVKFYYAYDQMNKDGDIFELEFAMNYNDLWKGEIKLVRFDPMNQQANASIDYISFCKRGDDNTNTEEKEITVEASKTEAPVGTSFEFDSLPENVKGGAAVASVQDGMLMLKKQTSPDFSVYLNSLDIDASKYKKINIGIKANIEAMKDKDIQIYFATNKDKTLDEKKLIRVKYSVDKMTDGEIYNLTIDMSQNELWKDVVTMVRVDPFYTQTEAYIDYIRFE